MPYFWYSVTKTHPPAPSAGSTYMPDHPWLRVLSLTVSLSPLPPGHTIPLSHHVRLECPLQQHKKQGVDQDLAINPCGIIISLRDFDLSA